MRRLFRGLLKGWSTMDAVLYEEQVKAIEKAFAKPLPDPDTGARSRWGIVRSKQKSPKIYRNEVCHASFEVYGDSVRIASNFDVRKGYEDAAEVYWDFMTGDKSPWRRVLAGQKPEKIFTESGQQTGFWFDAKPCLSLRLLTKNFVIAMRMIHEYPDVIRGFATFVDKGIPPYIALPMSKDVTFLDDGSYVEGDGNDGCHWPISIFEGFSFDSFRDGIATNSNSHPFVGAARVKGNFWAQTDIKPIVKTSRFTTFSSYNPTEVEQAYLKYATKGK